LPALREPGARYAPPRVSTLGLRALALIATSIGLLVIDYRQHELAWIRSGLAVAAWPLQVVVHSPVAAWDWIASAAATRAQLRAENEDLKATARTNQLQLIRLEAIQRENNRLLALLNATPHDVEKTQVAKILKVDLDPLRHRVLIDRGARDGVTHGQPAVDSHGIFGQVTSVGPLGAEVILLSDPTHAIPVQVERNGLRTIAVGTGDALRLSLPYLPRNADIKVDDHLVTSGLDGIFPEGYPVARVLEVTRDPSQPLATVSAEPAAALDRDREIMLLWLHPRVSIAEATPVSAPKPMSKQAPVPPKATRAEDTPR
jgi:rod shape-determining protein MreC